MTATSDTAVGPYNNEYFFHLKFDETGKEVTSIEEMVDSQMTVAFFSRLQLAAKNAAASRKRSDTQEQSQVARL